MAYLGKSPNGSGVRSKFVYTASGNETSLSGADSNGNTLKFSDGEYVDVYLNGVLLVHGSDYGTGTANTISSLSALTASDVVEILVYDIFTMAKVNSEVIRSRYYKTASGSETSISGNDDSGAAITFAANAEIEVKVNGVSLVQGTDYNTSSANTVGGLSALSAGQVVEIIVYSKFTLGDTVSKADGGTFAGNIGISGDLTVDTTTLKVDSSNNRVGIGTASPAVLIHGTASAPELRITSSSDSNTPAARMFYTAGSGWNFRLGDAANNEDVKISTHGDSYFNGGDVGIGTSSPASYSNFRYLQVNATTNAYLKLTNNTTGATINDGFDVAVSGSDAMLINRESANMTFATAGNERMRIDATGILLHGKTATNSDNAGFEVQANGAIAATRSSGHAALFNRLSDNGAIINLRKDGTTIGLIGVDGGDNLFVTGQTGNTGGIYMNDAAVSPAYQGTERDNYYNLGKAPARWKDLYLSGGAYIGGTGSANYLDDYEEGTFTATLNGGSGHPGSRLQTTGQYIKVGHKVTVNFEFNNVNTASYSGHISVFGMPFAATNPSGTVRQVTGSVASYTMATWDSASTGLFARLNESGTEWYFYANRSNDAWYPLQHTVGTGRYLIVNATYITG